MGKGALVIAVSDIHTNSHTGVCPNYFEHEGGAHKANPLQRWLWRCWKDLWTQRVPALKKETGLPVVLVFLGDAHDGDHHDTPQIITRNENDQLRLAVQVIEPALDVADRVFILRGTEVHTGKSAWREENLADDIGAERAPGGTASWWRLYAEFGGVTFDARHHPETTGRKAWTLDAAHGRLAFQVLNDYVMNGMKPPDVVLRAHSHRAGEGVSRQGKYATRAFTTPPWQKTTAFGHRISAGINQDTGAWYFVCKAGKIVEYDDIIYEPKKARPHRIDWNESTD